MTFRADFYFQTSVNLLLGVAFVTLASTGKVDVPSLVCFVLAYGIYLYLSFQQRAVLLSPARVSLFSRLYMLIFVVDMFWISRSFVDAAIHLLIFIQILKFFSEKKDKDFVYLIAIAFMEVLTSAAMTISASFFFAFLVFLVLVISTLVSFEMKRSQESVEKPAELSGMRRSAAATLSSPEGRRRYGALAITSTALSAGIVVIGALIFFALPRVEGGFLSRAESPVQAITGFSSTVRFGEIGSIKRNQAVVMRVEIEGDPRQYEGVKWRGIALNSFDGQTWYRALGNERLLARDAGGNYRIPPDRLPPPHRLVRYRIMMEPVSTEVLFAAARARTLEAKVRVRIDPGDSLSTEYHPGTRIRYDVISDIGSPGAASLRSTVGTFPPEIEEKYLQLPRLDPRIYELARQLTRADKNVYDRVLSVERYLRDNFGYTLDLPQSRERDPIAQFLFKTKRGHCEYFASSMAILLRTIGIPTRVVNGFQTGEFNEVGKDFIVREADAHSWVEVFFNGYGWIAFDPTPPVAMADRSAAIVSLSHYLDALELFWINWVVGYDSFRQVSLFQDLQHRSLNAKRWAEQIAARFGSQFSAIFQRWFLAPHSVPRGWIRYADWRIGGRWAAAILAILGIATFLWRRIRERRRSRSPQPRWAADLFSQWLRALARRGYVRRNSQTALEFSLSISNPSVRASAVDIAHLYNQLRFDPSSRQAVLFQDFHMRIHNARKNL